MDQRPKERKKRYNIKKVKRQITADEEEGNNQHLNMQRNSIDDINLISGEQ